MPECQECGANFASEQRTARFCCTPCRQSFNNRRMQRGAELYDLLMAHNYERKTSRPLQVWSLIYRLVSAYRDADVAKRRGRRSWRPAEDAIADIPFAFSTEGDKR